MLEYKSKDLINSHERIFIRHDPKLVIANCPEHIHEFIEIVYIYSGCGAQWVNNIKYQVSRGGLLFINIGDTHAHHTEKGLSTGQCFIDLEFFKNEIINQDNAVDLLTLTYLKEFNNLFVNIPSYAAFEGKQQLEMESIFNSMEAEFTSKSPGYMVAIKGYINIIFTKIFRAARKTDNLLFETIGKITPEVLEYIQKNYNKKITLSELAQKSSYNPAYFSTLFKEFCGKNLTDYLSEIRVKEAIRQLKETKRSVKEICFAVGYQSKTRFFKVFKAHTGLTPSQYRKNI